MRSSCPWYTVSYGTVHADLGGIDIPTAQHVPGTGIHRDDRREEGGPDKRRRPREAGLGSLHMAQAGRGVVPGSVRTRGMLGT